MLAATDKGATEMRNHLPVLLTALLVIFAWPAAAQDQMKKDYGLIRIGKDLFRGYCTSCHGEQGEGDGPIAEYLKVATADLTRISDNNDGEFPFDRVMKKIDGREKVPAHGSSEMPIWGDAFQKAEGGGGADEVRQKIAALTQYLRSIQTSSDEE